MGPAFRGPLGRRRGDRCGSPYRRCRRARPSCAPNHWTRRRDDSAAAQPGSKGWHDDIDADGSGRHHINGFDKLRRLGGQLYQQRKRSSVVAIIVHHNLVDLFIDTRGALDDIHVVAEHDYQQCDLPDLFQSAERYVRVERISDVKSLRRS